MQTVTFNSIEKLDFRTKESYKTLRTNLEFSGKDRKVISITSSTPNEMCIRDRKGDVTCMGILLTGCSGIRIGELCALKWGDISFEKGTMHIGRTLQRIRTFCSNSGETGCYSTGTKITITSPKSGNSDREIPLPGYLLTLLQKWRGRQEDYLMPGRKKEYTEPRTLQYRFLRILKSLGIPSFNFHMLRHIFATNCISHGFDMKTVSELLGHSNVTTTMRIYVHSDMQRKKMLMADYRMTA